MTKPRPTYKVDAQRSGKWWTITSPDVPGAFSQARRLDQIEAQARDAISLLLSVRPTSFDLDITTDLPIDVSSLLANAERQKAQADDAATRAAEAMQLAARELTGRRGFSMRDAGALLGVSHQRIDQLVKEPPPKRTPRKPGALKGKITIAADFDDPLIGE